MEREAARSFVARVDKARQRFIAGMKNAREEQPALLRQIVADNRDTVFGREHGFAGITSYADYRRAVPVRTYEGLKPWIDRTIAGERDVLSAAVVKLFLTTTGSTGEPKSFPITQDYLTESTHNTMVFWSTLVGSFPELLEHDDSLVALHIMPRAHGEWTPAGVPVHKLINMAPTLKGLLPHTHAPWYPPPADVGYKDLTYFLLRSSIESPLCGFICMHSSRLTGLLYALKRLGPDLVEEVRAGTMFGRPFRDPNPARARELSSLLSGSEPTLAQLWPSLRFATAWRGGTWDLVRSEVEAGFGVPIVPYPCSSTEGAHINMPVDGGVDGPLTIRTNFYEFRRVTDGAAAGDTMTFEDLEEGPTYEMILSSRSGLYRYSCGDLFRVVGDFHGVPRIEFVARAGAVNLTGEKLSEEQARTALDVGLRTCGLTAVGATCCASWGAPPFYTCVFEPSSAWTAEQEGALARTLDVYLREQNSRYAWKRDWDELEHLRVKTVSPGTFARVQELLVTRGRPLLSIKDRPLQGDFAALELYEQMDRAG